MNDQITYLPRNTLCKQDYFALQNMSQLACTTCATNLNSHDDDGRFLLDGGVGREVGQRVHPHAEAGDGRQVQPIRIPDPTHAVFGHGVDCAIPIPEDDGRFLQERS